MKEKMTLEELHERERAVQLGEADKLPDGRKLEDVRRENAERDRKEAASRAETDAEAMRAHSSAVTAETKMKVAVTKQGVVTAAPVEETKKGGRAEK